MRKHTTRTRLYLIGFFALSSTLIWISSEIYRQYLQDSITPEYQTQITPLNPKLPTEVLDQIEKKNYLPVDLTQTGNILLPTPSPGSSDNNLNFVAPSIPQVEGSSDTIPL